MDFFLLPSAALHSTHLLLSILFSLPQKHVYQIEVFPLSLMSLHHLIPWKCWQQSFHLKNFIKCCENKDLPCFHAVLGPLRSSTHSVQLSSAELNIPSLFNSAELNLCCNMHSVQLSRGDEVYSGPTQHFKFPA